MLRVERQHVFVIYISIRKMRFAGSRSQAVPSPSSSSTSSATQKSIALKMLLPLHDYVNYKLDFPILGSG